MRRFILHKILPSALLLGMVFPLLAAAPQEYSDRQLKLIAQMTAQLLSRNHYRQQQLAQQQRQYRGGQPFHWAASTAVAESKVRVYSISWGVLMAVVSPITVSGVSSARTGISKVEPPSVVRTS